MCDDDEHKHIPNIHTCSTGKLSSCVMALWVCGFVDGKMLRERERDYCTHRPLHVLVVTVGAEQVDAEADAGGNGKVSDGPPLLHLGCK